MDQNNHERTLNEWQRGRHHKIFFNESVDIKAANQTNHCNVYFSVKRCSIKNEGIREMHGEIRSAITSDAWYSIGIEFDKFTSHLWLCVRSPMTPKIIIINVIHFYFWKFSVSSTNLLCVKPDCEILLKYRGFSTKLPQYLGVGLHNYCFDPKGPRYKPFFDGNYGAWSHTAGFGLQYKDGPFT